MLLAREYPGTGSRPGSAGNHNNIKQQFPCHRPSPALGNGTVKKRPSGCRKGLEWGALASNIPRVEENRNKGLFPGLLTLLLTGCVVIFAVLYISDISTRLNKLDRITSNHTSELAEVRAWAFPASMLEGKFTSLNARMQALTDAFTTLEAKIKAVTVQQEAVITASMSSMETAAGVPAVGKRVSTRPVQRPAAISGPGKTMAAAMLGMEKAATDSPKPAIPDRQKTPVATPAANHRNSIAKPREAVALIDEAHATDKRAATAAVQGTGPWAINLLSSRSKVDTERLAAKARSRDIPVEQTRATVMGKEYWRLQITGFGSAREAKSYAGTIIATLGLKDYWLLKR